MKETALQNRSLLVLLLVVTLAFIGILLPFYGAVFWAVILGIVFAPLQRRLQLKFGWQRNLTSLCTLGICLVIAILPVIIISVLLVQEGRRCTAALKAESWTLPPMCRSSSMACRRISSICSIGSVSVS